MPLMTVSQYARHRGVSHQAVSKAVAERRIKKDRNGKIDSDAADRAWALRTNPAQAATHVLPPAPRAVPSTPMPSGTEQYSVVEKLDIKTKMAHLREKEARAEMAEKDLAKLKGLLMSKPEVDEYIAFFSQMVRDHMMAVPDRLAPALAAVNEPSTVHKILKTDIDAALRKLSKAIASAGF